MTVTLKRINVVVLFVSDLERSVRFYRDTLGLPAGEQDEAFFQLDGVSLLLVPVADAQDLLSEEAVSVQPGGVNSQLVAFVEDVDAIHSELVTQGVEFVRDPVDRDWGLRTAHFKDPDGHIWELAQPIAGQ